MRSLMLQDDASSNPDDLEREYFEKFERRNWTFSLGEGKWGVRINPVSFGLSVLLIWGFAVRSFNRLGLARGKTTQSKHAALAPPQNRVERAFRKAGDCSQLLSPGRIVSCQTPSRCRSSQR